MLARMKVGQKIGLSFAVAVLLAASTAAVAWRSSAVVADHLRNIADAKVPSVEALKVIDEAQTAIWGSTVGLISRQLAGTEMRAVMFRTAEDAFKRMDEAWARYEALPHGEEAMRRWKALAGPWGQWRRQAEATIALARDWERLRLQGVDVEDPRVAALVHRAAENVVATEKNYDAATADLRALVEQTQKDVQEKEHEAVAATSLQNALLLCGLVVSGVLLALLGTYLARTIGGVVRDLNREAKKLTDAVGTGELGVRGDAAAVNFEFRGIVEGMNATMDAFQRPIDVTVDYLTRIARGDLPPAIADRYEGDFDKIKLALNGCIAAVSGLVEEMKALSAAAVEGKLSTRADASQHDGEFGRIVEGVNGTLDAVMKPIEEATGVLEKLAARDLTARVVGSYRGDHARIKEALNGTAEALHEALEQVAQAVTQVSAAAGQIASSSQAVADGASEQASSLEETSSSLESMSSMTKQASDNAQQANGLAQTAKGAAAEGGAAMEQMTGAMGKIKASAEGTSQIIKDINEIAFQTNLLALNAAVEAARAGEAGRGFAVVAEEVRSLAMRSKEAAQKTEELIRQSVKEAGEGEVTAKHVSGKLLEIAGSISKVTDIVAEIAASAKEQAAGIDQVNKAVGQMDKVTQQNAANSEESSSAAAELAGQSEELAAMIGSFQLERTGATVKPVTLQARKAAPPPARAAPRAPRGTASRCAPRT